MRQAAAPGQAAAPIRHRRLSHPRPCRPRRTGRHWRVLRGFGQESCCGATCSVSSGLCAGRCFCVSAAIIRVEAQSGPCQRSGCGPAGPVRNLHRPSSRRTITSEIAFNSITFVLSGYRVIRSAVLPRTVFVLGGSCRSGSAPLRAGGRPSAGPVCRRLLSGSSRPRVPMARPGSSAVVPRCSSLPYRSGSGRLPHAFARFRAAPVFGRFRSSEPLWIAPFSSRFFNRIILGLLDPSDALMFITWSRHGGRFWSIDHKPLRTPPRARGSPLTDRSFRVLSRPRSAALGAGSVVCFTLTCRTRRTGF